MNRCCLDASATSGQLALQCEAQFDCVPLVKARGNSCGRDGV